jgi:hypothetical protein
MDINIEALEAVARVADDAEDDWYLPNSHLGGIRQQDKDYIAAADPAVVLDLIERLSAARALLEQAQIPVAYRVKFDDFRHFSGATITGQDYVKFQKPDLDCGFFKGCDSLVVTPLYTAPLAQPDSGRDVMLSVAVAFNELGATVVVSQHHADVQTVLYSETHQPGYEGAGIINSVAVVRSGKEGCHDPRR